MTPDENDDPLLSRAALRVVFGLFVLGLPATGSATTQLLDADGDGVPNAADAFPCETGAVAAAFYPGQGDHGMVVFEDLWPANGDLDFNDAVITYNYIFKLNQHGHVHSVRATFNALALGGDLSSGLGLQLPVSRWAVALVTRVVGNGQAEVLTPSSADPQLTVRISDNLRELFGNASGPINADPNRPVRVGQPIEVEILFWAPIPLDISTSPYDLFIFRSDDPSHEIHRPEFGGTAAMNTALFLTGDDGTSFSRSFVNTAGLPFALSFPTLVPYPSEGVEISRLYPDILQFAASNGATHQDFYVSNVVPAHAFRDVNGQPLPEPRFIGRSDVPAETGCIPEWGLAVEWGTERAVYQYGSKVTPEGHAVVTGHTLGAFPGFINAGGYDLWIGRYDTETGHELWVRQFGGAGDDVGRALALDDLGNIYVAGQTGSALLGQPLAGGVDVFVMKLDQNGILQWVRTFGGSGNDTAFGIDLDGAGNVFVTGGSSSGDLPGATAPGNAPASFLVKLDNDGNRLWTQHYLADVGHPSNFSYNLGVAVDRVTGDAYVAGSQRRYGLSASATESPFVARHQGSDGALLWVQHVGGHGYRNTSTDLRYAFAFGVGVDDFDGSVYATGAWYAGSGVTQWGEWHRAAGDTSADGWVAKLSPGGSPLWSYTIASENQADDIGGSVVVHGLGGTAYFTGRTDGRLPGQTHLAGADYYLAAFAHDGTRRFLVQHGTWQFDQGAVGALQVQGPNAGALYVVGNAAGAFWESDGLSWDVTLFRHDLLTGAVQHQTFARRLRWTIDWWGPCLASCGEGFQTRSVVCTAADGTVLPDAYCPQPRPPTHLSCARYDGCQNTWEGTEWSACSESCGTGTRTRDVHCRNPGGAFLPDGACSHAPRPAASEACASVSSCTYAWDTGAWSACVLPSTCVTGSQSRSVVCQRSDGAAVEDGLCGARPVAVRACVDPSCVSAQSCSQLYEGGQTTSGRYLIDVDGPGPRGPVEVYCDMASEGGGWTNLELAADRIHLENGHFIACTGGLTPTATSVGCAGPLFDGDAARPLYHFGCSGSDRSADYLLDHVGQLVGHRAALTLGFSTLSRATDPAFTVAPGAAEHCYVGGFVVPWSSGPCSLYAADGNDACVIGSFTLGL